MRLRLPVLLLAVLVPVGATAQDFRQQPELRELRRAGGQVVSERLWDIDGDGQLEFVVVARRGEMLQLSLWRAREVSEEQWRRHQERYGGHRLKDFTRSGSAGGKEIRGSTSSGPAPHYLYSGLMFPPYRRADELVRLEVVTLGAGRRALWYEVAEQNPDEDDRWVQLIQVSGQQARFILEAGYRRVHPESEAGRPARRIIGARPEPSGVELVADPDEPWALVMVHHPAEWLQLRGPRGTGWLATGHWTELYRYREERYRPAGRSFADALVRLAGPRPGTGPLELTGAGRLRLLRGQARRDCPLPATLRLRLDGGRWLKIDPSRPQELPAPLAACGSFTSGQQGAGAVFLVAFDPPPRVRRIEISHAARAEAGTEETCTWSWEAFADGPPAGGPR